MNRFLDEGETKEIINSILLAICEDGELEDRLAKDIANRTNDGVREERFKMWLSEFDVDTLTLREKGK